MLLRFLLVLSVDTIIKLYNFVPQVSYVAVGAYRQLFPCNLVCYHYNVSPILHVMLLNVTL